jgi:predicted nucleic acid-binding protein
MILVDASVWIDFFRGRIDACTDELARLLEDASAPLRIADLTLFEVLRGFADERDFKAASRVLSAVEVVHVAGEDNALRATDHYRLLRKAGQTNNSLADLFLASYCIEQDCALLHNDRDFDVFENRRGLKVWRGPSQGPT